MAKDSKDKTPEPVAPKAEVPKPAPLPVAVDPYVPAAGDPSLKEIEAARAEK